jgi:hypothetical protein
MGQPVLVVCYLLIHPCLGFLHVHGAWRRLGVSTKCRTLQLATIRRLRSPDNDAAPAAIARIVAAAAPQLCRPLGVCDSTGQHWKYVNCPDSTVFAAERLAVNFCKDGEPDGVLLAMEPTAT